MLNSLEPHGAAPISHKTKEEERMKILIIVLTVLVSLGLAVSGALAFMCPSLQKAANESIAKAEEAAGKVADATAKGRAMARVEVAKGLVKSSEENHKKAVETKEAKWHYLGETQARAAKAVAEMQ